MMEKILIILVLWITSVTAGWSQSGTLPVQTIPSLSPDTLSFAGFDQLFPDTTFTNIRVVGAGATSFTGREGVLFSNRLIQYLVLEKGFRAIALLRDDWKLRSLDQWLTNGEAISEGEARRLTQQSFPHSVYCTEEMAGLLKWLKAFDNNHPDDPVRLKGLNFTEPMSPAYLLAKYVFPADSLSGLVITKKRCSSQNDTAAYDDIINWFRQKSTAVKQKLASPDYADLQTDIISLQYLRKWPVSSGISGSNYFDSCLALNIIRLSDDPKKLVVCADNAILARAPVSADPTRKNPGTFLNQRLGKTYFVALTDYYDRADLFWIDPASGRQNIVQRFSDKATTARLLHQDLHIDGGMVRYNDLARFHIPIIFNVHPLYAGQSRSETRPGMIAFDTLTFFADEHPINLIR